MKQYTVLILEDEKHNADILKKMIARVPSLILVAVAEDGYEALNLCRLKLPDILLADIEVPVKNGMSVAKDAAELGICVVFTTKITHMALDAYRIGAAGYLTKPFDFDQFKKVLNDAAILVEGRRNKNNHEIENKNLTGLLTREYGLSPAETELSILILSGCLREELSARLGKTERAVKSILQGIYKKTVNNLPGVKSIGRSDKYGRLIYLLSQLEKKIEKK